MMKLSTMKKVVDTVDHEWRSSLAEKILNQWGYDEGSVYYFRASANFIFVFRKNGKRYFLRFNATSERDLKTIEAEIETLLYLRNQPVHTAQPVKSLNDRYIEIIETDIGTFYAVVFEGLQGEQHEFGDLKQEQFVTWGGALGRLHHVLKEMPEEYRQNRSSWNDKLAFVKETLPNHETAAVTELEQIIQWAEGLSISKETFGLIHYDFELDNLYWNHDEVGILDFDDCLICWYVADIAFALRDLFEDCIDLSHPFFQEFIKGYSRETEIDTTLLQDLPWFMRMHSLVLFATLLRTVDIEESENDPEWLIGLRRKLLGYIEKYRASFEKLAKKQE